jgi:hypothetical protein
MRKGNILDINGASPNKAICGVLSWHLQADTSVGVTLIMPGTVVYFLMKFDDVVDMRGGAAISC